MDAPGIDRSVFAAQLKKTDNRIEKQDWSGQDLSGRTFAGKVLVEVNLHGATLRDADLTETIICDSNLTNPDLAGAHLDRALIGGATDLDGASLVGVTARNLGIADASGSIRIDGADLRGANTFCDDFPRCVAVRLMFSSMIGADLRGAAIGDLCCSPDGLATAKLSGLFTRLVFIFDGTPSFDLAQLAAGVGETEGVTFVPAYGFSSRTAIEFTGKELRQLPAVLKLMQAISSQPSFDCSRARSAVEKSVCADPKLSALDNALSWLWEKVEHTPQEKAVQTRWLADRMACPQVLRTDPDPRRCLQYAYVERIKELGAKTSQAVIGNGRFTTDAPLRLPEGADVALARKFLRARGYREDEITVDNLGNGGGKLLGNVLSSNYHECNLDATEAQTRRTGSTFRLDFDTAAPDDKYYLSFVTTPYAVVMAGGDPQFQCGVRASWSDAYFRQPDDLVSSIKPPVEPR